VNSPASGRLPVARFLGAACLTLMLGACVQATRTISPGVPSELKHSWEESFNKGDVDGVAALYANDAQLAMSGAAPIRGVVDIRRAIKGMIGSGIKVRIDTEQNVGSGDIAYVYGAYTIFTGQNGAEVERGSYVEVWRRRNGVWKIDLDVNAASSPISSGSLQ
jgi:ketosteroid isomerase-like protein